MKNKEVVYYIGFFAGAILGFNIVKLFFPHQLACLAAAIIGGMGMGYVAEMLFSRK